ncbi:hypothetical protein WN48_08323 [Eufriesea mexicana]|uniref:Uncharacterized protein n=1 Tax=Eufriesea mexicana TaxID=516756 RepID=A0A310SIX4_9HYME|nr:hypothetical protein WN48_08323 [Eufriesea mexicana]
MINSGHAGYKRKRLCSLSGRGTVGGSVSPSFYFRERSLPSTWQASEPPADSTGRESEEAEDVPLQKVLAARGRDYDSRGAIGSRETWKHTRHAFHWSEGSRDSSPSARTRVYTDFLSRGVEIAFLEPPGSFGIPVILARKFARACWKEEAKRGFSNGRNRNKRWRVQDLEECFFHRTVAAQRSRDPLEPPVAALLSNSRFDESPMLACPSLSRLGAVEKGKLHGATVWYSRPTPHGRIRPQPNPLCRSGIYGRFQAIVYKHSTSLAVFGQTFDEIVVSSDLNVRRKSKESRQGKRLTNIPSGTTGPPEKSTAIASRLVSNDGSRITPVKTQTKREISNLQKRRRPISDDDHVSLNDAHVCVTTILLGTRQPPDDRWWGLQRVPYPRSVRGSDRSIPWPVSSFAHPIPRVILAPGIKAIADSRIAASCKKFANQLDPFDESGARCLSLTRGAANRTPDVASRTFRVSWSLYRFLVTEDGAVDQLRPTRRGCDDRGDGVQGYSR